MSRNVRYLVLLVLLTIGIVSSVQAVPPHGFYVQYFSDASMTELVGEREYWCYGGISSWGDRTEFLYGEDFDCPNLDNGYCYICVSGNCTQVMCGA
ncbi:MAG TPA: hypothetical protein VFV49_15305 [Thermoanaerobaculia bacterium]|nr:hypothetical protein [Thermoanaerobaculia bacterium]